MEETLVKVGKISVDCEKKNYCNNEYQGRCYRGFDFNVRVEELEELKIFIREELKNIGLPVMSIYSINTGNYIPERQVSTKQKIKERIRSGYQNK